MSTALYRVYRPQKFSEVSGQGVAVSVLEKELISGRTAHAYLFSGARGCGKTTAARLMAKALNCANPIDGYEPCCVCPSCISITNGENLDVIEIDGASNNGVDEIRELKTHVALAPFNSRRKVYIIDEVHMLSAAAFNALLKTLEEPPEYVVFILATTEPHKVPVTIRSRCQHIPFHRIRPQDIAARLGTVCKAEELGFEEEALWEIARQSDGALRDALSLLDQAASIGKGKITLSDVSEIMGGGSLTALERWLSAWRAGSEDSFGALDDMFRRGASPQRTLEELFAISRNLWVARNWDGKCLAALDVSSAEREYLEHESQHWDVKALERLMLFLSKLIPSARVGMRTDILVGILMARRYEIMNGADTAVPRSDSTAQAIVMTSPVMRPEPVKPALNDEPQVDAPRIIAPITTEIKPQAPKVNLAQFEGGILPAEDFILGLKEKSFALYCALLGSVITRDGQSLCVSVDSEYIYHFISGGKNSAVLAAAAMEKYHECKVFLKFGEMIHECVLSSVKTVKREPKTEKTDIKFESSPAKEQREEKEKVESHTITETVQNALKFLRGEVVIHRVEKDAHEGGEFEEEAQ